jgi:toxin YoeB
LKLIFADDAWDDYIYWQKQDKRIVERINKLIRETQREPFAGVGKPEPLKHALSGYWSRRINDEHRMVYRAVAFPLLSGGTLHHSDANEALGREGERLGIFSGRLMRN